MSQSITEFASIILYVTIGFCLLVSLLDKNRSFKTVDHGTLFISTDPLLKMQMFIIFLSFGVVTLSSSHVAKHNGEPIPCFYTHDKICSQEYKAAGINLRCFEEGDPRCVDGYLQISELRLILSKIGSVCIIIFSFIVLIQKGIRIDKSGICKEWEILPFRHTEKIYFDEMNYATWFIRGVKIISIRGKISGVKFGAGYLYAQKDIDFLQNFILEKLAEISKAEAAEQNTWA
ncbi:hypothetical protein [uncultured Campylobacter sp.]|uniref:hypothetical protein n=1 Tax=uncultured Campylobacter sp. TaxID=218934 RepID=UPI00262D58C3|nr:hypothetical protein [uncultured Campylobacter sp.]